MTVDLYRDDLETVSDADLYATVVAFTRAAAASADRTQEGYLLDFKAVWNDSGLRTVAAFANTFGGLLLVGVSESQGRADQVLGIGVAGQELKTAIASSIASNISPTPSYEIREIAIPNDPGKHICFVRVRKGKSIYLITKKDEKPVYVRNEDENRPADAARLQALFATRLKHDTPAATEIIAQLPTPRLGLFITEGSQDRSAQRKRSETFLQLSLLPEEPLNIRLDLAVEEKVRSIVRAAYPGLASRADDQDLNLGASFTEERTRDEYRLSYFESNSDYGMRWIINGSCALYFVSQVRWHVVIGQEVPRDVWSLADVMTNLDCTIEVAHALWRHLGYPGEGTLNAELRVEQLELLARGQVDQVYAPAFYERDGPRKRARPLSTACLRRSGRPNTRGFARVDLTYATRSQRRADAVAVIINQLLRDLGHAVNLDDLRPLL